MTDDRKTIHPYIPNSVPEVQAEMLAEMARQEVTLLAVNGGDILTAGAADTASTAVSTAIDTLNTSRAGVGAAQNRLQFAADNNAIAMENAESARSSLMDLDIASEMTTFTSKQILVQAGVSMVAQANQLPQNLLRLFA